MVINIDNTLRLRTITSHDYDKALPWYQDEEFQYLVNGVKEPFNLEDVENMYRFLSTNGELYYIEVLEDKIWKAIGDVALMLNTNDDLPIAIGEKKYWEKGIGTKVIQAMIKRATEIGRTGLRVEIYHYNYRSRHVFEKCGFKKIKKTNIGYYYYLNIVQKQSL